MSLKSLRRPQRGKRFASKVMLSRIYKATDLASEVIREEYVPGGQVSVDKVFPCQVAHPGCNVFTKLYKQLWGIFWDMSL